MNEPIRVLCVFSTLDQGGAESMCMNLYRHIDREKVQFDFVKHTSQKCAFDEEILSMGGRIFVAPRFRGANLITYRKWWKDHLKMHPEHQIIHGHYFTASKYYFSVCKKTGRTTVGHSHTDTYGKKEVGKRIMIHRLENYCDYRLACSEKAGKLLYPHKDFIVLRNAIAVDQYTYNVQTAEEVRKEYSLGDAFVLGTVGTIKEVKNPLGIVDIFCAVSRERPNSRLLWVGRDEGMMQEAIVALEEKGQRERVIFTGPRSDVNRLMQAMDCFILPSFSEGLPVTLIEAQAAGLPCYVSSSVSDEADITGLIRFLPLDEWVQWSKAICSIQQERRNTETEISQAGYDIKETSAWLQQFYLGISKAEEQMELYPPSSSAT